MIKKNPYHDIKREELIPRDHLAILRTVLANERTLLAYARTAIGLLASGAGLLEFINMTWAHVTGWGLLVATPIVLGLGFYRFLSVHKDLKHLR